MNNLEPKPNLKDFRHNHTNLSWHKCSGWVVGRDCNSTVLKLRFYQQQNTTKYSQTKFDLHPAFIQYIYFPFNNWLVSHGPWSFMLDLAFQFSTHLALSWSQISVCLQWEFQPTRAQPLLSGVEGCVRKMAGEAKRRKRHCAQTCEDEKWQWMIAARGKRSSASDCYAITADEPDNT